MRDHHCCTVPGCRNALFLDLHHLELRSEGGGNQADNLITLCGAHHRAAHRGELRVTGSMGVGLRFQHADGSDYGQLIEPRRAGAEAQCFAALRHLGFREGDVRRALTEVARNSDGLELEPGFEGILRSALAKLTASIGAVEPKRRLD